MNIEEIREKIKELKEEIKKGKEALRKSDERTIKIIKKAEKKGYTETEVLEDVNSIRETLLKNKKMRKYFEYDDLTSESYLIYSEYIEKLIQWKKGKLKGEEIAFPKLDDFVNQKISDLIRALKEIKEHEWLGKMKVKAYEERMKAEGKRKEDIGDYMETFFSEEDSDLSRAPALSPPSPEERYIRFLISYTAQNISKLEKILFENEKEHFANQFRVLRDSKSLYQIAKEKKVTWGRLTYILRTIGSPVFKIKAGRCPNLVFKPVFDKIFPFIQIVWKLEDNYKRWIALLKREGWSKSRISHFMRRKIDKGIVPSYYFDIVSPSAQHLSYLRSRKKKPIDSPRGIWRKGDDTPLTHKEIIELLKEHMDRMVKNNVD